MAIHFLPVNPEHRMNALKELVKYQLENSICTSFGTLNTFADCNGEEMHEYIKSSGLITVSGRQPT